MDNNEGEIIAGINEATKLIATTSEGVKYVSSIILTDGFAKHTGFEVVCPVLDHTYDKLSVRTYVLDSKEHIETVKEYFAIMKSALNAFLDHKEEAHAKLKDGFAFDVNRDWAVKYAENPDEFVEAFKFPEGTGVVILSYIGGKGKQTLH